MLNTASVVAPIPTASLPAPSPTPSDDSGQAFAQALDQATTRQRDAAADSAEPTVRDAPPAAPDTPAAARTEAADTRPAPGARAAVARKVQAPDGLAETADDGAAAVPGEVRTERQPADEARTPAPPGDNAPMPPDLAAWVSSLPLSRPAPAMTAAAAAAATAAASGTSGGKAAAVSALMADAAVEAGGGPPPMAPGAAASAALASARPAEGRHTRAASPMLPDASTCSTEPTSPASRLDAVPIGPREPAPAPRPGAESGLILPAMPGPWTGAPTRPADPAAPLQAELQAPVGSSQFAPALGSQLSVLVRDGIDHAQLRLNPAEMGPIEVRISIDGTQAQVDFSAAHAATRQALQDAVPALASALRENGLTLTGGGVFEQAREQRGDARQDGSRAAAQRSGATPDGAAAAAAVPRMPRARGVVDLYA